MIPSMHGGTFGGGYDRGHMVPNAAIGTQFGSLAQTETFLMTNMCPQKEALNQHTWADLEKWIRKRVEAPGVGHLFVIVGPIFGENPSIVSKAKYRGIQIPDAFYCIIADADEEWEDKPKIKLLAYIFPQDTPEGADFRDRVKYGASVEQIEKATKLNFFPGYSRTMNRWLTIEHERQMTHW